MKRVCLDAGHYDDYNISPANKDYSEAQVMWDLHLLMKEELEKKGIEVITTRENQVKDLSVYDRGVKSKGCDLLVSLHSNAVGSSVNNSVDYPVSYCSVDRSADVIGLALAQKVKEVMNLVQNARIEHKSNSYGKDYYGILRGASAVDTPSLILENSFHTNITPTNWLLSQDNLKKLAKGISDTIATYLGVTNKRGWIQEDNRWYYYLSDDACIVNDWLEYDNEWYWFNGQGQAIFNDWYYYDNNWYYFDADCKMIKDCWLIINNKLYRFNTDGTMCKENIELKATEDGEYLILK